MAHKDSNIAPIAVCPPGSPSPLLSCRGIAKRFGRVEALRGVDLDVYPGEIVALVGDNGAGKSTLVKTLVGEFPPDDGTITFQGKECRFSDRRDAQAAGIEIVYQDLAIAPHLEPCENFFLNRELYKYGALGRWFGVLDRDEMRARMRKSLAELGIVLKKEVCRISELSGGQQQGVAVTRSAHWASNLLFLDEPTAALGVKQTKGVLDLVRRVRDRGISIVYISHDIPEILEVSDRIHVLRRGETAAIYETKSVDAKELVLAMTGAV
jgi:simple sugar transport system ATP-binding protein